MTKMEMVTMGTEFRTNYYKKYLVSKTITYKYRGELKTRESFYLSEEGQRIDKILYTPMFKCPDCGNTVSFNELESWLAEDDEDFINDLVPCSMCYENMMGEDL